MRAPARWSPRSGSLRVRPSPSASSVSRSSARSSTGSICPGEEHHGFSTLYNVVLPIASVVIALIAIYIGYIMFYRNRWKVDVASGPFGWSYRLAANKFYIDDIYMKGIVKPIQYVFSKAAYWIDRKLIDGVVNGVAGGTVRLSNTTYEVVDQEIVDYAVNGVAGITGMTGGILRYVQTGNVQRYAAALVASVALFVGLLVIA